MNCVLVWILNKKSLNKNIFLVQEEVQDSYRNWVLLIEEENMRQMKGFRVPIRVY